MRSLLRRYLAWYESHFDPTRKEYARMWGLPHVFRNERNNRGS